MFRAATATGNRGKNPRKEQVGEAWRAAESSVNSAPGLGHTQGRFTHSSVLAWRTPGMGKPGGLPSLGSQRVGHDQSDLAAAAGEM